MDARTSHSLDKHADLGSLARSNSILKGFLRFLRIACYLYLSENGMATTSTGDPAEAQGQERSSRTETNDAAESASESASAAQPSPTT